MHVDAGSRQQLGPKLKRTPILIATLKPKEKENLIDLISHRARERARERKRISAERPEIALVALPQARLRLQAPPPHLSSSTTPDTCTVRSIVRSTKEGPGTASHSLSVIEAGTPLRGDRPSVSVLFAAEDWEQELQSRPRIAKKLTEAIETRGLDQHQQGPQHGLNFSYYHPRQDTRESYTE